MSLINCPECQMLVSSNAKACPKCGYSLHRKRNIKILLIVLGLALIVGGSWYIYNENLRMERAEREWKEYLKYPGKPIGYEQLLHLLDNHNYYISPEDKREIERLVYIDMANRVPYGECTVIRNWEYYRKKFSEWEK